MAFNLRKNVFICFFKILNLSYDRVRPKSTNFILKMAFHLRKNVFICLSKILNLSYDRVRLKSTNFTYKYFPFFM